MDITFSAANTVGLNNPGTEIITLVKDESGNFINPPSYDKMRAYLRSGEVPMLFVTDEGRETGSLYQLVEYSEIENKIRFSNDKTTIEFSAGAAAPVVSDVVPNPLTFDYMPEGYPKKTMGAVTVMEEQELKFASIGNGIYVASLRSPFEIVEGQTYTVNWDGTEYECVCVITPSGPVIGNLSIMGADNDTGEPFLCAENNREAKIEFYTLDTSASHTISVKTTEEIVTPMTEEFLPAGAVITYNSNTSTYSSELNYNELYERLQSGQPVMLHHTVSAEYEYLTKWRNSSAGKINLAFGGGNYSVSLLPDGSFEVLGS